MYKYLKPSKRKTFKNVLQSYIINNRFEHGLGRIKLYSYHRDLSYNINYLYIKREFK